jgi:hypothetical protein
MIYIYIYIYIQSKSLLLGLVVGALFMFSSLVCVSVQIGSGTVNMGVCKKEIFMEQ